VILLADEETAEKVVSMARGTEDPGRPKAKALGYQPLVFAEFFAGLKPCANPKSNDKGFVRDL
jgi:hypothetical protein